jgi:hypothetical protein
MTLKEDIQIAKRICDDADRLINEHRKNVMHSYLTLLANMTKLQTTDKSHKNEND